jgi:hypothetical protein
MSYNASGSAKHFKKDAERLPIELKRRQKERKIELDCTEEKGL